MGEASGGIREETVISAHRHTGPSQDATTNTLHRVHEYDEAEKWHDTLNYLHYRRMCYKHVRKFFSISPTSGETN